MAETIAQEGVRLSSGPVNIILPNVTTRLWTLSGAKVVRAKVKKIMWMNRTGGNGFLRIGYLTLGAVFTQVLPDILMIAGIDGHMEEDEIPLCGNIPEGFAPDTTAVAGTLGHIDAQSSVGAAIPTDVQVTIEVEEIG